MVPARLVILPVVRWIGSVAGVLGISVVPRRMSGWVMAPEPLVKRLEVSRQCSVGAVQRAQRVVQGRQMRSQGLVLRVQAAGQFLGIAAAMVIGSMFSSGGAALVRRLSVLVAAGVSRRVGAPLMPGGRVLRRQGDAGCDCDGSRRCRGPQ